MQNTNNSRSTLTNNLSFNSQIIFLILDLEIIMEFILKNFNATAKNDDIYKSNLQSELMYF